MLGRYGIIYKEYIQENNKILYGNLIKKKRLLAHCEKREKELKKLGQTIENQLREKHPRPNTDSFIELAQYENYIAATVNELVLDCLS